jgi:small multidrug resistance family-3 protein
MSRTTAIGILLLAALLEAGGDAIVRGALHRQSIGARALLFALGAGVLFAYGVVVNSPPWEFARLLGLYVVFFFVTAQMISWIAFGQPPTRAVLLGGVLIVAGGFVIALNQN